MLKNGKWENDRVAVLINLDGGVLAVTAEVGPDRAVVDYVFDEEPAQALMQFIVNETPCCELSASRGGVFKVFERVQRAVWEKIGRPPEEN